MARWEAVCLDALVVLVTPERALADVEAGARLGWSQVCVWRNLIRWLHGSKVCTRRIACQALTWRVVNP